MAKKDITRRAVERVAQRMSRALDIVKATIPYGPERVQMSPSELQSKLRNARGETLLRYMDLLGEDAIMEIVRQRRGTTSEENE